MSCTSIDGELNSLQDDVSFMFGQWTVWSRNWFFMKLFFFFFMSPLIGDYMSPIWKWNTDMSYTSFDGELNSLQDDVELMFGQWIEWSRNSFFIKNFFFSSC